MKAVVMNSFGGPEVLHTEERPLPRPRDGEILIRVRAAGVNPVDCKIRSGSYKRGKTELPSVPGRDVAGVIEAIGPQQTLNTLKRGDEVYAFLSAHAGGYADYAVARENEVAVKPRSLDYVHAAGVPLAAVTAWQALFDHGQLTVNQRVLIHGAAGGVGHFAVQLAKAQGAYVIATTGPEDLTLVRSLGADEVIDYQAAPFETHTRDIDLVIDLIGGETQRRSWQVIKPGGTIVSTLEQPDAGEAAKHQARTAVFMARPNRPVLTEIARLIDAGKVKVVVQKTYELDEAAKAQDELEHKHSVGKRVLVVR